MDISEYDMPASCFSRYRYTRKIRTDLAKRYINLKDRIKCKDAPEVVDFADPKVSIFISKSWLKDEQFSSIEKQLGNTEEKQPENTEEKQITNLKSCNLETFFKEKTLNEYSFIVTSQSKVVDSFALPENLHIIFVAEKGNENVIYNFNDKKNLDICPEENVRQVISTHLERCALTGMKDACEFLEVILNNEPQDKTTADEQLKRYERGSTKAKMPSQMVRKRPQSENYTSKSVHVSAKKPSQPDRERPQSEKYTSKSVSDQNQKNFKTDSCLAKFSTENKESIERLVDEIMGMFNRSRLPKHEHPDLKICIGGIVHEQMLRDLRRYSPPIRSCGYRFSTFQVYVDGTDISENLKDAIEKTLKQYKISAYSIVPSEIKLFSEYNVGDKVSVTSSEATPASGTLGGFASSEEPRRLWLLMSRHVAMRSGDGNVYISGSEESVAKIMKQIEQDKNHETDKPYLDIAAACVDTNTESKCDTRYITENKTLVQGKLSCLDASELKGLPVHIRGASTPLGLGTITVPKQYSLQDDGVDKNYILIEDRDSQESDEKVKFCKEGDSGAIVCAESPDNYEKEVLLVSMVVGGNTGEHKLYATVRLDKGIDELDKLVDEKFNLC